MATELTCPQCGGHRIAQTMSATIDYLVEYDPDADDVEITEPADIQGGHAQYEITEAWDSYGRLFCATPLAPDGLVIRRICNFHGPLSDFLPKDPGNEGEGDAGSEW